MSETEPILVQIKQGKLRGKIAKNLLGGDYYSFQGIPYGKAPVGKLRFKAPLPADPWTDIFDATKEGPECPSAHLMFLNYVGAEDNCLNLNVYTKELPKSNSITLKPVMVWIHGGAFLHGSNKSDFFGPDYFMVEDVVQVYINYRLGVLGFLSLEDKLLDVPGNAAFKDMVLALKWVQDNVSSFGGDPNNVTIFGESAGSACVQYLVLSPLAKGLFHKAIMQSGSVLNCWARGKQGVQEITKCLGLKETDESKVLEILENTSPKKLVNAQMKVPDSMKARVVRAFGPVIENPSSNAFISEEPEEILKSGKYNKVPMIFGFNTNEGMLFDLVQKSKHEKLPSDIEQETPFDLNLKLHSEDSLAVAERIRKFYFGDEMPNAGNIDSVHQLKSDHHFIVGIFRSLQYSLQNNVFPIYLYQFSFEGEYNFYKKFSASKNLHIYFAFQFLLKTFNSKSIKNVLLKGAHSIGFKNVQGTAHADDLGYLFRSFYTPSIQLDSKEAKTIRRMVRMWTNFARYGNPTPGHDEIVNVDWKEAEKNNLRFLDIGDELKMDKEPFKARREFWESLYADCHAK